MPEDISHELRTPLSIINAGLDVVTTLLNEENYNEAKETISDLHFPARTAVDLLNDLLAYEKLFDSGLAVIEATLHAFIEATLQDPLVFVNDTLHPFYLCARGKNITLAVTSDVTMDSCRV